MDPTAQTLLIGAITGGAVAILAAIGLFIRQERLSKSTAKQTDLDELKKSYQALNASTEEGYNRLLSNTQNSNAQLTNLLNAERLGRAQDKVDCQTQIAVLQTHQAHLQAQLTALMNKLPEPGAVMPVVIAGVDPANLAGVPVVIVGAEIPRGEDGKAVNPLQVVIQGPLPIPTTAAEKAAAAQAAKDAAE